MSELQTIIGGDAFPVPNEGYPGMSLLDYFAGQAMAGMQHLPLACSAGYAGRIASACYDLAAAMVAESEARQTAGPTPAPAPQYFACERCDIICAKGVYHDCCASEESPQTAAASDVRCPACLAFWKEGTIHACKES